jgi:hypothetical protein
VKLDDVMLEEMAVSHFKTFAQNNRGKETSTSARLGAVLAKI